MLYLSDNLKHLRNQKGWSQEELARCFGITRSRYSKYEYGLAEPPIELLMRMAAFYQVRVDHLLAQDLSRFFAESPGYSCPDF